MRKNTKRSVAVVAAAVVAVGGGAAAWAAWTANTTGSGKVQTGTASAVTIEETVISPVLVPGNKASVQVTLKNPNNFHVKVKNVEITSVKTTKTGCGDGNFTFTKPAITALTLAPVTTNGDTQSVSLPNAVGLKASPNNACQDAEVTVSYKVDAESTEVDTAPANPPAIG